MGIARIILVVLVAASVAVLPAAASVLAASQPAHASMTSDDGSMPCKKANDGKAIGCCVLMCFNFLGAVDFRLISIPRQRTAEFPFVDMAVHAHPGSPPTHPPKV
jgi:hypothetical protein